MCSAPVTLGGGSTIENVGVVVVVVVVAAAAAEEPSPTPSLGLLLRG
jgi:hypothetical protein